MGNARLLLLLLITTIECLPVLVKVLLTFGPANSYEKILALAEEEETRAAVLAIRLGVLPRQKHVVVARTAARLVALTARLLPTPYRARYAEEFCNELLELAEARASKWQQIGYAARQLARTGYVCLELKAPFRRKASP
jgi:hypothetical protein